MKKLLLSLCLMLLCLCLFAFSGQAEAETSLVHLYAQYSNGESSFCSLGTVLSDKYVLMPACNLPENLTGMLVSDGKSLVAAEGVLPIEKLHIVVLGLPDASLSALPLPEGDTAKSAGVLSVVSSNEQGDTWHRAVESYGEVSLEQLECALVRLNGEAALGSPVLTEGNELAGMIVAAYGDATQRYMVLTSDLLKLLLETLETSDVFGQNGTESDNTDNTDNVSIDFSYTLTDNLVTLEWKAEDIPQNENGGSCYLLFADEGNPFYSYVPVDERSSLSLTLTPGRSYKLGLLYATSTPRSESDNMVQVTLPQAEKLTDYNFTAVKTGLIRKHADGSTEDVSVVDRAECTGGQIALLSSSTYVVTEEIDETLHFSFTDPDGVNYFSVSSWLYSPEYMTGDVWDTSLEEMGLEEDLAGGTPGIWTVDFYIGGKLADSFTFELK